MREAVKEPREVESERERSCSLPPHTPPAEREQTGRTATELVPALANVDTDARSIPHLLSSPLSTLPSTSTSHRSSSPVLLEPHGALHPLWHLKKQHRSQTSPTFSLPPTKAPSRSPPSTASFNSSPTATASISQPHTSGTRLSSSSTPSRQKGTSARRARVSTRTARTA